MNFNVRNTLTLVNLFSKSYELDHTYLLPCITCAKVIWQWLLQAMTIHMTFNDTEEYSLRLIAIFGCNVCSQITVAHVTLPKAVLSTVIIFAVFWFGLVWLCWPWILRSSNGISHFSGIPSSSPRGVEPPSTRQLELQTAWD